MTASTAARLALAAALMAAAPRAGHAQAASAPAIPSETAPDAATPRAAPLQARLFTVGAGALLGITAFNVLSAPLGVVPLAGAALAAVPVDIALGSRVLAIASAGAGAAAALLVYDYQTGQDFPTGYVASIAAGALVGVMGANLLSAGTVGTLPYYPGSGAIGGELASSAAQAASRVYVIGAGVLGGLAGASLYESSRAN